MAVNFLAIYRFRKFTSKSLEVMTSIIVIRITDISGSRAIIKLFFLNTMHKVKA